MVAERSLNPESFAYGSLHYYAVAMFAVLPPALLRAAADPFPPGLQDKVTRLLARALSGMLATATVYLTYALAARLFGGLAVVPLVCAVLPRQSGDAFSFVHFADGFLQELAFNAARGSDGPQPPWPLGANLLRALVTAVAAYAALYTIGADLSFLHDARELARQGTNARAPAVHRALLQRRRER